MYKILIIIIVSLISFSCATSSGGGGSLSDAFRESQEDNGVPPSDDDDDGFIFWPEPDEDAQYDNEYSRPTTDSDEPLNIPQGFQTSVNFNINNEVAMGLGSDYILGDYINKFGLFFITGLAWNTYYPNDLSLRALNDSLVRLNIGLHHRYSLTPRDKGIYLDLILDTIVTNQYWQYKHPLSNGDEYDGLMGLDIGGGIGLCIQDEDGDYFFIDPSVGFNLMGDLTHSGLINDVFKDQFYIKLGFKFLYNKEQNNL